MGIEGITDNLVKGTIEVTTTIKQLICCRQLLIQPTTIGFTDIGNELIHPCIRL